RSRFCCCSWNHPWLWRHGWLNRNRFRDRFNSRHLCGSSSADDRQRDVPFMMPETLPPEFRSRQLDFTYRDTIESLERCVSEFASDLGQVRKSLAFVIIQSDSDLFCLPSRNIGDLNSQLTAG